MKNHTYAQSMSSRISTFAAAAAALVATLLVAAPATADVVAPCETPTTTVQSRDVTGQAARATHVSKPWRKVVHRKNRTVVKEFRRVTRYVWQGAQTRTVTSCGDSVVSATEWSGAKIVRTGYTERIR